MNKVNLVEFNTNKELGPYAKFNVVNECYSTRTHQNIVETKEYCISLDDIKSVISQIQYNDHLNFYANQVKGETI